MAELFKEGVPAPETPIRSAEIRDNFGALYDKLKTLEPRATTPESTQILIAGGPIYFRAGSSLIYNQQGAPLSGALQLVQFKTSLINLATASGFKTIKNPDGTLSKEPIFNGLSPFETAGLYREVLITVNNQGRLSFTEGATTTTALSRPFDIAFDDSEVPICLVMIQQSGSLFVQGQLANIRQIDITDVRPVVTTAFQNNLTSTALQLAVEDNTARIDAIEPIVKSNDNLRVRIPVPEKLSLDGLKTTNKKVEVISGAAYVDGIYVRYPGGFVDVAPSVALPTSHFGLALVAVNSAGSIVMYHPISGESNSSPNLVQLPAAVRDGYGNLQPPAGVAPLALIYFRMESTEEVPMSGTTTEIRPVVSETFVDPTFNGDGDVVGGVRFNYSFNIVSISSPTEFVVNIPTDIVISNASLIPSLTGLGNGQSIDILDDNSRPIRRQIINNPEATYNSSTRNMVIVVSETLVNDVSFPGTPRGISLKRHPKVIAVSKNLTVLEDVRPFVTEI